MGELLDVIGVIFIALIIALIGPVLGIIGFILGLEEDRKENNNVGKSNISNN